MVLQSVPYGECIKLTCSVDLNKHLSPNNLYFLFVKDNKIVSLLSYSIFYLNGNKTNKIEMVITEMKYRNNGLASKLLEKFLSSLNKKELLMTTPYTPLGIQYLKHRVNNNPRLVRTEVKSGYKVLPVEGYPLDKVNKIIYVDEYLWRVL